MSPDTNGQATDKSHLQICQTFKKKNKENSGLEMGTLKQKRDKGLLLKCS